MSNSSKDFKRKYVHLFAYAVKDEMTHIQQGSINATATLCPAVVTLIMNTKLHECFEFVNRKFDDPLTKLDTDLTSDLYRIRSLMIEFDLKVNTNSKSVKQLDIINKCHQIVLKYSPTNSVNLNDIVPPYNTCISYTSLFSELILDNNPIRLTPVNLDGVFWRLVVYTDWLNREYIGVFLQRLSGVYQPSRYQCIIEMLHQSSDVSKDVSFKFAANFGLNDERGNRRFYRRKSLLSDGFLHVCDSIHFRYYVRAPTFHQKCRDLQVYTDYLEIRNLLPEIESEEPLHVTFNTDFNDDSPNPNLSQQTNGS